MNGNIKSIYFRNVPKIPDHKAVISNIHIGTERGSGYWKLNTSWLNDDNYKNKIRLIITDTINSFNTHFSPSVTWDICKIKIKEFSIKYAIATKKEKYADIANIESRLEKYDLDSINQTPDNVKMIADLKNELKVLYDQKYHNEAKGAEVRSRIKWVNESDQNPKFFKAIEHKHQTNNKISYLKDSTGNLKTDTNDLLEITTDFYSSLFSSKNIEDSKIDIYLNNLNNLPKLSNNQADQCEQEINELKLLNALKGMKKNKAPGSDGLPAEFDLTFWEEIKFILIESFRY